jgi:ketosteroid isomerase-like protein
MVKPNFVAATLVVFALFTARATAADFKPETIIALERSAIDHWGKGDPQGFLETYAPDVSYFDPAQEHRVDGIGAMKDLLTPITGKIKIDRYEMINPKVQRRGDIAVLSYQIINHVTRPGGQQVIVRWNSTTVYERSHGSWKIIHSHFSYTRPELKRPPAE